MILWNQFDDNEGNTLAGMIGCGLIIQIDDSVGKYGQKY